LFPFTAEEFQVDSLLGILVSKRFDQLKDRNLDTKFFAQFASKAFFECFIRFALAAGEFPKASEMSIGVAPSD